MRLYIEEVRHRAQQRLGSNSDPAPELLRRLGQFLKLEERRLRLDHCAGLGGLDVTRRRAELMDVVLAQVHAAAVGQLPPAEQKLAGISFSILAVGGYGRAEICPLSDVDMVFLVPNSLRKLPPWLEQAIRTMVQMFFDLPITLGSRSTFSVSEAIRHANADLRTKTAFLESRLVVGDEKLFATLQRELQERCLKGRAEDYLDWRVEDQEKRRQRSGPTPFIQEPNIKDGCGGLRDYQNLIWIGRVKEGVRSTAEMVSRQLLTANERRQLDRAYDFLLRVRNEMHYLCRRKGGSDILTLEAQSEVARNFRYPQPTELRRSEAFMRDYYLHTRNIQLLSETLFERMAIRRPAPSSRLPGLNLLRRTKSVPERFDGFYCEHGMLFPEDNNVFDADPFRLMRVFRHAQERQVTLSPALRQLIRSRLSLANWSFRYARPARAVFELLISQQGQASRILRMMHEVNFLGRYIPEFDGLTCLVQHDFFHRYTADEHTLVSLEKLDSLAQGQGPRAKAYQVLLQGLSDPFVLCLALLLHETGRSAETRLAAEASALFAVRVGRRLQLGFERRRLLTFLIDHQHTLAHTAQSRNVEDPATVAAFAEIVRTQANLDALMLFTVADSQAMGETGWSEWKECLCWQLYSSTSRYLAGERAHLQSQIARQSVLDQALAELGPEARDEIQAHCLSMPDQYFRASKPSEIVGHLELFREFFRGLLAGGERSLIPAVSWTHRPEQAHSEVVIAGWDRAQLLARICGVFAAVRLNILSAELYPRRDDLALAVFRVCDARRSCVTQPQVAKQFEELLGRSLGAEPVDLQPLLQAVKTGSAHRLAGRIDLPTRIAISNDAHPDYTLVDFQTRDRLGLLYDILRSLQNLGLRVVLTHITTERGAAIDSFYVVNHTGQKITSETTLAELRRALRHVAGPN